MAQWLDEKCEQNASAEDTCYSLLTSWQNYAKSRGEEPGSSKSFGMTMSGSKRQNHIGESANDMSYVTENIAIMYFGTAANGGHCAWPVKATKAAANLRSARN